MSQNSSIIGYDPGGNKRHGVACITFSNNSIQSISVATLGNTREVIEWIRGMPPISIIGIDTLTVLSTGDSGWRPADLWLREEYKVVRNSVINPNYLQGSMSLSGLACAHVLRADNPELRITETHPKVLYHALTKRRYNYVEDQKIMDEYLSAQLGVEVKTEDDHQWDAMASAFAAWRGISREWKKDLHLEGDPNCLVKIVGNTHFYWPEDEGST